MTNSHTSYRARIVIITYISAFNLLLSKANKQIDLLASPDCMTRLKRYYHRIDVWAQSCHKVISQGEVSSTEERVLVKGGPRLATRYGAEYNKLAGYLAGAARLAAS